LKIIACIKYSYDVAELKFDVEKAKPILSRCPRKMGDIDKSALEEAIRVKERVGGSVAAVCFGPPAAREIMREALAMGADEAYIIDNTGFEEADTLVTSKVLAEAIKKIGFDIVFCGESSIDGLSYQVGPRVAWLLKVPCITHVRKIEVKDGKVKAERDLEDCFEVVECDLPVLVSVTREINTPRLPSLPAILRASKKPIELWKAAELVKAEPAVKVLEFKVPEVKRKGVVFKDIPVEEAVNKLAEELVKEVLR